MPGSLTAPRVQALAVTRPSVLPSALRTASAPRGEFLSRLNGWPMHSPADASSLPSRATTHGSGPVWIATPSLQRTFTSYSLPVSRRTRSETRNQRDEIVQVLLAKLIVPRRVERP
jgi:hypothetical protein